VVGAKVTAGELLTLQVLWHVADRVSQFIRHPAKVWNCGKVEGKEGGGGGTVVVCCACAGATAAITNKTAKRKRKGSSSRNNVRQGIRALGFVQP
jgi:hypothetical protein